jgi:hypothetical protein
VHPQVGNTGTALTRIIRIYICLFQPVWRPRSHVIALFKSFACLHDTCLIDMLVCREPGGAAEQQQVYTPTPQKQT